MFFVNVGNDFNLKVVVVEYLFYSIFRFVMIFLLYSFWYVGRRWSKDLSLMVMNRLICIGFVECKFVILNIEVLCLILYNFFSYEWIWE